MVVACHGMVTPWWHASLPSCHHAPWSAPPCTRCNQICLIATVTSTPALSSVQDSFPVREYTEAFIDSACWRVVSTTPFFLENKNLLPTVQISLCPLRTSCLSRCMKISVSDDEHHNFHYFIVLFRNYCEGDSAFFFATWSFSPRAF